MQPSKKKKKKKKKKNSVAYEESQSNRVFVFLDFYVSFVCLFFCLFFVCLFFLLFYMLKEKYYKVKHYITINTTINKKYHNENFALELSVMNC